jgi:hypothetical protein
MGFSQPLALRLKNVILKVEAEGFSETYYLYTKLHCFIFHKTVILRFFLVLLSPSTQNWGSNWNRCHEHCTHFSHQNFPIIRSCIICADSKTSVHKPRSEHVAIILVQWLMSMATVDVFLQPLGRREGVERCEFCACAGLREHQQPLGGPAVPLPCLRCVLSSCSRCESRVRHGIHIFWWVKSATSVYSNRLVRIRETYS